MKLLYLGLIFFGIALNCNSDNVDSVLIKGYVVSNNNYLIPDITVHVVDSELYACTDSIGYFELKTPIESVLMFSKDFEPLFVSLCSFIKNSNDTAYVFKLDINSSSENHEILNNLFGVVINVNTKESRIAKIIACYDTNIKAITKKRYDYYKDKGKLVSFVIDGIFQETMDFDQFNFDEVTQAYLISPKYDRYTFIFSRLRD